MLSQTEKNSKSQPGIDMATLQCVCGGEIMNLNKLRLFWLFAFCLAWSSGLLAQISENIEFGGSGCQPGTVRATVSPDGDEVSILFDEFSAETKVRQAKIQQCEVRVPIRVPSGFRVMLTKIDYRGFAFTTPRAQAAVLAQAQIVRAKNRRPITPWVQNARYFKPDTDEPFDFSLALNVRSSKFPCGTDSILRLNTYLMSQARGAGASSLIQLDSIDGATSMKFKVQLEKCNQ